MMVGTAKETRVRPGLHVEANRGVDDPRDLNKVVTRFAATSNRRAM